MASSEKTPNYYFKLAKSNLKEVIEKEKGSRKDLIDSFISDDPNSIYWAKNFIEDLESDLSLAEKQINSSLEIDPNFKDEDGFTGNFLKARIYATKGELKSLSGQKRDYVEAINYLKRSLEFAELPATYCMLGLCYEGYGNRDLAIQNLQKCVDLDPESEIGIEAAKELERLKTKKRGGPCFIATTIYGSPYEYEVLRLKEFRDFYLSRNFLGRTLIKSYYKKSPIIANILSRNQFLKIGRHKNSLQRYRGRNDLTYLILSVKPIRCAARAINSTVI